MNRFLKSSLLDEFRDIYMPSTGALILLTALHTCDQVNTPLASFISLFEVLISKSYFYVIFFIVIVNPVSIGRGVAK